ncbi:MAG: hypothetical protein IJ744_02750 [Lachnospiraceae bacterium]|nr:hypothetical protein [Lachnospiraceae bacterium]
MERSIMEQEILNLSNQIQVKNQRIAELKGEISQCGFFQRGKKRELEAKLAAEQEGLTVTLHKYQEAVQRKQNG